MWSRTVAVVAKIDRQLSIDRLRTCNSMCFRIRSTAICMWQNTDIVTLNGQMKNRLIFLASYILFLYLCFKNTSNTSCFYESDVLGKSIYIAKIFLIWEVKVDISTCKNRQVVEMSPMYVQRLDTVLCHGSLSWSSSAANADIKWLT